MSVVVGPCGLGGGDVADQVVLGQAEVPDVVAVGGAGRPSSSRVRKSSKPAATAAVVRLCAHGSSGIPGRRPPHHVLLTPRGKAYGRAIWLAQDALNETVRSRVSEADLAAADAVLRAVFPDDEARQRVDERIAPPGPARRPK